MSVTGKRFCPNCGSDNVEFMGGGMTGSFMCSDCDFMGSVFPERAISKDIDEDIDDENEVKKEKKSKTKISKSKKKGAKKK